MSEMHSPWCRALRLAVTVIAAGGLQMGMAAEAAAHPPKPLAVAAVPSAHKPAPAAPAVNPIDGLLAELTPPGTPAQIVAITQAFERGTVLQKEQLLVGLGTARMTNAISLVVDHAADEDPVVALAALRACQDLGPSSSEEFKHLHAALDAADTRVQTRAAILLAHLEDESSLPLLINRMGTVAAPEAKATLDLLHDLSGKDLGDTAQPWQAWMAAEIQAADAKMPVIIQRLASKDPEQVIGALKEASTVRLRRSELVAVILPLLAHADAQVATMAELSLKALGGPAAKQALRTWQKEHPLAQAPVVVPPPIVIAPSPPTIASSLRLSPGTQDFLVVGGILFTFIVIIKVLGRPTKKVLVTIDNATGGHVTRRLIKAKAQGRAALKATTTYFRRSVSPDRTPRSQPVPPALERKTPQPQGGAVTK